MFLFNKKKTEKKKKKHKTKQTQNAIYECYADAILKKNNFGHKRQKELTLGPCQTDSLRLSLLHPDIFRCKLRVGISI